MRETADIQKVPAKQEKGKPSGKDNVIFLWKRPQSCLDIASESQLGTAKERKTLHPT